MTNDPKFQETSRIQNVPTGEDDRSQVQSYDKVLDAMDEKNRPKTVEQADVKENGDDSLKRNRPTYEQELEDRITAENLGPANE